MVEYGDDRDEPLILHCFADFGVESEALAAYGNVVRVGIGARDTNESEPIKADVHDFPIKERVTFDLGLFHPICKRWASMTSLSGDPEDHPNQIPLARELAHKYCDHYIIENKPEAPLHEPVVLNGKMFGLPIAYERAFETSFRVTQPPRHRRFGSDGSTAETSPFFFSERSHKWWRSVKGYLAKTYTKQHMAKNCVPAPYIHHICRDWLKVYEEANGDTADRPDYSDYDSRMDLRRNTTENQSIYEYMDASPEPDAAQETPAAEDEDDADGEDPEDPEEPEEASTVDSQGNDD